MWVILVSKPIADDIKLFSYEICQKHHVMIRYMETDKDHIHYMIETQPTMSVSKMVNWMKIYTTYSYLEKTSKLSAKTFLERAYFLDRWIFCLQCRECSRRNAGQIYRKSRIRRRWRRMLKTYKYRIYPNRKCRPLFSDVRLL